MQKHEDTNPLSTSSSSGVKSSSSNYQTSKVGVGVLVQGAEDLGQVRKVGTGN